MIKSTNGSPPGSMDAVHERVRAPQNTAICVPRHSTAAIVSNSSPSALRLAEGELELESSLHVTSFTAASCFSRFSASAAPSVHAEDQGSSAGTTARAAAPPLLSLSAPSANHDDHARQLTNLVAGNATRGLHLSDPSGADGSALPGSISERQRDISVAACLATPAEPAELFVRARVVTRAAAEVEVEAERLSIVGVPDAVEAGLYNARRWVDTARRLRLRQARLARKSMGSMSAPLTKA
ncbi:hypothetical protein FOA52_015042 [Chlamydomonas sp. UWO 241]|nr:hypothetical protein FOA52_015042 [Chlamydomonas sp. UWO 241]